jgi:hypothetical protein
MTNVPIEKYRGFQIIYSKIDYVFEVAPNANLPAFGSEKMFSSKSLQALRKQIDKHIKESVQFAPFRVQKINNHGAKVESLGEVSSVVSVRKDNLPIKQVGDAKSTIQKRHLRSYILYFPENDPIADEVDALDSQFKHTKSVYEERRKDILARLKVVYLKDHLDQLLPDA